MTILGILLAVIAALLLVPSSVLLVQVLASLATARQHSLSIELTDASTIHPDVQILMPAHNEANGIAVAIHALLPQLGPRTQLLVVADNCNDETASIARTIGSATGFIRVVERKNEQLRGKGYALDHGVRYLSVAPPQILIVLDADCILHPGSIQALARACMRTGRPTQSLDLMKAPHGSTIRTRLAEFAWMFKNRVRALGFHHLDLPCQLMGTGMAFNWKQISEATLASGNIVEDLQLGIDFALRGTPPLFCPNALVTSYFPSDAEGVKIQRARWEHGHLGVIISQGPKLLWQGIFQRNGPLFAMALDLCVPPLALLAIATSVTLGLSIFLVEVGGSQWPANVALVSVVMMSTAVMLGWHRYGREIIGIKELSYVPFYVLAKLPLYLFFLIKRQSSWVRSKRDSE